MNNLRHKIFISRDFSASSHFVQSLQNYDCEVTAVSLLTFKSVTFFDIPYCKWIFFYSQNGVQFFFEQINNIDKKEGLKKIKWAAIGEATAAAIAANGQAVDFVGNGNLANIATDFLAVCASEIVLFVQAKNSRESIAQLLDNQIISKKLIVYDNQIKNDFWLPKCDFLVFTSPLNVVAYCQKFKIETTQKVFAIGATTALELKKQGVSDVQIAEKSDEKSLLDLLFQHLGK